MLKIGLVGVGTFGKNHARILNGIEQIEFAGICDKNRNSAREIADRYGIKIFESVENLLKNVDAIVIVTNTTSHYSLAKMALKNGKDVFIEKPITETYEQAKELVELAEKNNLLIQVGHIERFNPIVLKLQDKIDNPMFIEAHRIAPFSLRGTDISVVQELMIHDIDFVLAFISSEVENIYASGSGVFTDKIDIANARLEFKNGAVANITASRVSLYKSRKLRIFQKDAYFSVDFQEKKAKYITKINDFDKMLNIMAESPHRLNPMDFINVKNVDATDIKEDSLTMELKSFVGSVKKRQKPVVDGNMGARALWVANKILEKIKKSDIMPI